MNNKKFTDIIKPEPKITFSEYRNLISEIDKTWRAVLAEKELENTQQKKLINNLNNALASKEQFIKNELTQLVKLHKTEFNKMWTEIEKFPE